jgi:hypothetical protein
MDHHLKDFYREFSDEAPRGNFHSVIPLHKSPDLQWKRLLEKVPNLCRGWFELAHLSLTDRIEFTRDFWLAKLPYRPGFDVAIHRFFASLDDIGVYLVQKKFEDPYEANLVYSIKNNGGFFRGALPASEKSLVELQKAFPDHILPNDYMAFLQIHNGFCKATDCTGILAAESVPESTEILRMLIQQNDPMMTSQDKIIDPKTLIPFYESFGMPFYQCFWTEWYPEQEMGNVYYSGVENTISDVFRGILGSEIMAYPTFIDWLMFYLERVE